MMKLFLRAMLLAMILGSTSLAYAKDKEHGVYWMDNPATPKLAFNLYEGEDDNMRSDWYATGAYKGWKGRSVINPGRVYISLINPQGTASMVFNGTSIDKSGASWRGSMMMLDKTGKIVTRDVWIK